MRIYVDTCVYINAWNHNDPEKRLKARDLLADPDHIFVSSEFIRLELLAKASFLKQREELQFYEVLLGAVTQWVVIDNGLIVRALSIAKMTNCMGIDVIHLAAAERGEVGQFVTSEQPDKPLYQFWEVNPTYLYSN